MKPSNPRIHSNYSILRWLALLALLTTIRCQLAASPLGTAFTYQGKLSGGTNAATGSYDLKFSLFDALASGNQVGSSLTNAATTITNGYFTVSLNFGSAFDGNARWLEIGARTNGSGAFTTLSPRQPLTPSPYSLFASNTATLGGQAPSYYAPASGSGAYVAKAGDTMTGALNLPANGLVAGGNQLVLAGGNVGIGTSSPQAHLHVDQPSPGGDSFVVEFGPAWNGGVAYNGGDQRVIVNAWNGSPGLSLSRHNVRGYLTEVDASGALSFKQGYNGAEGERMRISGSGNIGIGTTNPATKFEVQGGPIKATGGLIIETRTSDPPAPVTGQIWLRTDL